MKQGNVKTERIEAARISRGWTQAELAQAIRVSAATVSRLERGLHLRPSTLYSVCRELGIPAESVMGLEPPAVQETEEGK